MTIIRSTTATATATATATTAATATATAAVLAMALGGVFVAACSPQPSFGRAAAIDSFSAANTEASDDQAACVVDGLIERLGLEGLEAELSMQPLDADFEETQFREMFRCGVAGDWQAQVVDQLTENGVDPSDAACVADSLFETMSDADIDVLLSGETTDSFDEKFLAALTDCDALNP